MGAANYIFANTGQLVRLVVQTLYGYADGYFNFFAAVNTINNTFPVTPGTKPNVTMSIPSTREITLLGVAGLNVQYSFDGINVDGTIFPGQKICLETIQDSIWFNGIGIVNVYGVSKDTPKTRADGYVPIVKNVIFPDLSLAAGYPQPMVRLNTGLYASGLQLPTGVDALGTYVATVFWMENDNPIWETFAINVARPFGISTVTPF